MNSHLFRDYKHLAREYYSGRTFVAFDTETTGLHCTTDFLLEIGAVKFNCNGPVGSSFDILIKPEIPIPPFISELTHITDQMVKDCPCVEAAVNQFLEYIGPSENILIAHNAPFDLGFINSSLYKSNKKEISHRTIDTLPLSRWAYPQLLKETEKGQYKLQSLAKRFSIDVVSAHRADDDARVCMELFKRIIQDTLPQQKDYIEYMNAKKQENLQLSLF